MNDEIKEILDKTKRWCDLALDDKCNTIMYKYELVTILDYITNLQQENERLKEKLSQETDLYEDTISYQLGYDRGYDYGYKVGIEDYKSRINKAIKYIKENKYYEWHTERDEHYNIQPKKIETTLVNGSKLMGILQGVDKE